MIWIYIHNEIAREDRLKKKIRRNSGYKIEQVFEKSRFFKMKEPCLLHKKMQKILKIKKKTRNFVGHN